MTDAIQDTGKVWLRGAANPVFALKIKERFIVPGGDEGPGLEYWVDGPGLCVDIQDPAKGRRIARWFPLDTDGTAAGTLFNGFTRTRHADICALTPQSPGVRERVFDKEAYDRVRDLGREAFWSQTGWPP